MLRSVNMGVCVSVWRARIGSYFGRCSFKNIVSSSSWDMCINSKCFKCDNAPENRGLANCKGVIYVCLILILLVIGGIEVNPGPNTDAGKLDAIIVQLQKLDSIQADISEFKNVLKQLETKYDQLECKVKSLDDQVVFLEDENVTLKESVRKMETKLDYLENQSRRNNLIFRGVSEVSDGVEMWSDVEDRVINLVNEKLKIDLHLDDIERAHRINRVNRDSKYPRDIVVKFNSFKIREKIWNAKTNLKGSQYILLEDFSFKIIEKRRILIEEMYRAREDGQKAIVVFDKLKIDGVTYVVDDISGNVVELAATKSRDVNKEDVISSQADNNTPTSVRLSSDALELQGDSSGVNNDALHRQANDAQDQQRTSSDVRTVNVSRQQQGRQPTRFSSRTVVNNRGRGGGRGGK